MEKFSKYTFNLQTIKLSMLYSMCIKCVKLYVLQEVSRLDTDFIHTYTYIDFAKRFTTCHSKFLMIQNHCKLMISSLFRCSCVGCEIAI